MVVNTVFYKLILFSALDSGIVAFLEQTVISNKIQLTASSDAIQGENVPLTISCKFDPSEHPEVASLISLKMSKRSFGSSDFKDLVTLTKKQLRDEDNFLGTATGSVTNDGSDSLLVVEYSRPKDENRGEYKCQAAGFDVDDVIVGSENTLAIGPVNAQEVLKCMEGRPRQSLTSVKFALINICGVPPQEWFQMLRDITAISNQDGIFYVSDIFESGSFYVFTEAGFPHDKGNDLCENYSGYLAEINTEAEFLFLKNAMDAARGTKPFKFNHLLTGASLKSHYGDFEFHSHPGASMYLGHWAKGEPNKNNLTYNWLIIRVSAGSFLMADGWDGGLYISHLCEVSKDS